MRHYFTLFLMITTCLMLPGCGGCGKHSPSSESKEAHSEEHEEASPGVIHLEKEAQELVGFETVEVKKEPLFSVVEAAGEIARETENVTHITSPEPGILKSLQAEVGKTVEKETPLCRVITAEGKEIALNSPSHGMILALYQKEGDKVDSLGSILTIVDPDILRASFNVYEKDIAGIEIGQKVIIEVLAYPDKEFEGKIAFVSPQVDPETRSIKVRAEVENKDHLIKFGMFVTGKILVPLKEEGIVVPLNSVQQIKGQAYVFIPKDGEESEDFLMRPVRTGRTMAGKLEIVEGLKGGETVVTKGCFYLKAELLKEELEDDD